MTVIIRDSDFASLGEALHGIEIPSEVRDTLQLIELEYVSFDREVHTGQMVLARWLAPEVVEIFRALLRMRFPIEKVIPVERYGWSDDASMEANNSSGFNWRFIAGTDRLSMHAKGVALDLNPLLNPCIQNGITVPEGAVYDPSIPGTLTEDGEVVRLFKKYGWDWGGDWTSLKDYQHFEKPL